MAGLGRPVTDERVDAEREEPASRPLLERLGLAAIAVVLAALFGAIGVAALGSGEIFLGVMASIGALMTLWAAASTLRRG
jgi:hypothetical protein